MLGITVTVDVCRRESLGHDCYLVHCDQVARVRHASETFRDALEQRDVEFTGERVAEANTCLGDYEERLEALGAGVEDKRPSKPKKSRQG